jgi:POT family proton-dependent oligopeptide transporter
MMFAPVSKPSRSGEWHAATQDTHGLTHASFSLFWPFLRLCIGILSSNSIAQAGQMRTDGVPNNLFMSFNPIALVIVGLIMENFVYPAFEKRRICFGDMARIVVGLLFMALCMAYSTIVQALIYAAPPCYNFVGQCTGSDGATITGPNDISAWIQVPTYALLAVSEVFALVTGQAYAYKQAPPHMKSLLQSTYAVFNGFGYLLAMAISPTAKNPNLVNLWASVTAIMSVATMGFWFCFRTYDKREILE